MCNGVVAYRIQNVIKRYANVETDRGGIVADGSGSFVVVAQQSIFHLVFAGVLVKLAGRQADVISRKSRRFLFCRLQLGCFFPVGSWTISFALTSSGHVIVCRFSAITAHATQTLYNSLYSNKPPL